MNRRTFLALAGALAAGGAVEGFRGALGPAELPLVRSADAAPRTADHSCRGCGGRVWRGSRSFVLTSLGNDEMLDKLCLPCLWELYERADPEGRFDIAALLDDQEMHGEHPARLARDWSIQLPRSIASHFKHDAGALMSGAPAPRGRWVLYPAPRDLESFFGALVVSPIVWRRVHVGARGRFTVPLPFRWTAAKPGSRLMIWGRGSRVEIMPMRAWRALRTPFGAGTQI